MIPIAMVFNIPEDAAAQIAYLEKRKYPISYVEMGEEPDGQYMLPEDYAALYVQFADALHKVDPALKLGGPVFTGQNEDILVWPDAQGRTSWTRRFVDYLRSHGHLKDLAFFSFEHYPYVPCTITWNSLYDEPRLVSHIVDVWHDDGVPADVPLFITESNISWQVGRIVRRYLRRARGWADYVGAFLTRGRQCRLLLPLSPDGNPSWLQQLDGHLRDVLDHGEGLPDRAADFAILRQPTDQSGMGAAGKRRAPLFHAAGDLEDPAGHSLVTAYATLRPDGKYSLLVINRDQWNAHKVRIQFHDDKAHTDRSFSGPVETVTFGRAQYQWHPDAKGGSADPDGPALKGSISANADTTFDLPAASMTVFRGGLSRANK